MVNILSVKQPLVVLLMPTIIFAKLNVRTRTRIVLGGLKVESVKKVLTICWRCVEKVVKSAQTQPVSPALIVMVNILSVKQPLVVLLMPAIIFAKLNVRTRTRIVLGG